ncbi:cysteine hydrolase [Halorubellus sp. JP-L1]|uniref:cysteine hydrolase family protein n=1 Tax=Halorubellus sp. JP-L1 TaxID=2715753 RepID=UPI00140DD8AE|nr:cysteine hydrolase [Halorubellus sp. JP-L1]NHN43001.1 cysteine hydrolase [Halorubellus sp. JP-L1]
MQKTAILTVDLHHGHLDPEIATLPVPESTRERVVEHAETLVTRARDAGYPVIHVTTGYRDAREILSNPKWSATEESEGDSRESISEHNIIGSKGLDILPELHEPEDVVLQPKKRYSPFVDTDIEFVLRTHDVEKLVIAGVNTNTCVQCTCFEATNRDYEAVVVEDCVGSMDGEEFHEFGLMNIDQALGRVLSLEEALDELDA